MQAIDKSKPIMVTGGSGYIAGWIVKDLLEEGVTVRATVRDTGLPEKVAHLNRLAESLPGKLRLFAADLLNPGAFVKKNVGYRTRFENAYSIKDLGISYRPIKETVINHFQQLIDDGLVPKK